MDILYQNHRLLGKFLMKEIRLHVMLLIKRRIGIIKIKANKKIIKVIEKISQSNHSKIIKIKNKINRKLNLKMIKVRTKRLKLIIR